MVPEKQCCSCIFPSRHETQVLGGWLAYCCACFDHDWPIQRLVEGQECEKERIEVRPAPYFVWRWKEDASG